MTKARMRFTALWLLLGLSCALAWRVDAAEPAFPGLIPVPAQVQPLPGRFVPGNTPAIALSDPRNDELRELGKLAADILQQAWNRPTTIGSGPASTDTKAALQLSLAPDAKADPESYRLQVDPQGIRLDAPTTTGLFYGLQTLRQLAPPGSGTAGIAAVRIHDAPRFGYRGLHLDVGRHLFPLDFLKRYLDLMARYKFNTFHWHLTDDQGWRLEIKQYPKLTSVGGFRKETVLGRQLDPYVGDGTPYGGFYTQAQARELVAYADKLHITVIPEIDMPGHMVAALAAYPELACTPGPFEVRTTWGVDDNILCPGQQTFTFVENVLDEVMDIFPSKYIHLGGDEAPTVRWENSPLAQEVMRREGLETEHALQGWFLRRVEKFVNARGRKIIGWDEILDGKPSRTATVMSWRGMEGGTKAAKLGHDVIMSPTDYAYLDYCQGDPAHEPICIGGYLPLRQVYSFEPVPDELTPTQARHILGGQGNVWTEYLKMPESVEYMVWPRALAMAEVLWSPRDKRDWDSFMQRIGPQLAALDRLGVNYRIPEVGGLEGDVISLQPRARLQLSSPIDDAVIRYTTDGSDPDPQSPRYDGPVELVLDERGTTVSARLFLPDGRIGPVRSARFVHGVLQPAMRLDETTLQPGLQRNYFEGDIQEVATLASTTPLRSDIAAQVAIPETARAAAFGLHFDGYLRVPTDGVYRFALTSDDGSVLEIDGKVVIDRDGPRSPGESTGNIALAAGLHPVSLRYFQGGGGKALQLLVSRGELASKPVPQDWWWHRP